MIIFWSFFVIGFLLGIKTSVFLQFGIMFGIATLHYWKKNSMPPYKSIIYAYVWLGVSLGMLFGDTYYFLKYHDSSHTSALSEFLTWFVTP